MNTSRKSRIAVGIVGPCLLGSLIMATGLFMGDVINGSGINPTEFIGILLFCIFFSIPFMGIQSTVYALLMEFVVGKRTDNLYLFIGASGMLGTMAGMTLVLIDFNTIAIPINGAVTGLIIGRKLYFMHERELYCADEYEST